MYPKIPRLNKCRKLSSLPDKICTRFTIGPVDLIDYNPSLIYSLI